MRLITDRDFMQKPDNVQKIIDNISINHTSKQILGATQKETFEVLNTMSNESLSELNEMIAVILSYRKFSNAK